MRFILSTIISLIFAVSFSYGQVVEGVITYSLKQNMHRRLPNDRPELRSMIPEFATSEKELYFNREASFITDIEDESAAGGSRRMFRMGAMGKSDLYINLSEERKLEQIDFFGDIYLIDDEVKRYPWMLRGEMKKIQGMVCQLAYFESVEDSLYVEAWFTPEIPLGIGPEMFRGLPGAVLSADVNLGERVYTATSIKARPLKDKELKIPSKGKKVTQKEYDDMVKTRMEEFRARMNSGGRGGRGG
jgi:GLPGLI family protein